MRGVLNHLIDDDSQKEYFYKGEDDNNKVVLDTIVGTPMENAHMLTL